MNIKKYNKFILAIMICIFTVTIVALLYNINIGNNDINNNNLTKQETMQVNLYFSNPVDFTLGSEKRTIPRGTNLEITSKVLEELLLGPKSQTYKKSIPDNVEILDVEIDGEIASVNLSSEYNNLNASDAPICRAALIYTLTDLGFIDGVKISVDNVELRKANGEIQGVMKKNDVVMGEILPPEPLNHEKIKLYFSNQDTSELVEEEREVEVNPNQHLAKYIMEQLIVGPRDSNHLATVPPETKIKDIKVKDGVCYVDLSEEFITKHTGGSFSESITIYSIVNSLTEIPEIKKVQFLIEGQKRQEFTGHVDFSKPFERESLKVEE